MARAARRAGTDLSDGITQSSLALPSGSSSGGQSGGPEGHESDGQVEKNVLMETTL